MSFWKNFLFDVEENAEPSYEPSPEDFEKVSPEIEIGEPAKRASKKYSSLQARLFIKTVNDYQGHVSSEWLGMFDRELMQYAVNIARQAALQNYEKHEYNRFFVAKNFWTIVDYLKSEADNA